LLGAYGIALVDWCCRLLEGEPTSAQTAGLESVGFASVFWEFGGGRGAQIVQSQACLARPRLRLHVLAEQGTAAIEWPSRVSWTTQDGKHVHVLPRGRSLAEEMLERFHRVISYGHPAEPSLEDAYRVLGWLRAAGQSLTEGRRIDLKASQSQTANGG
jgi:predicted dehydrogenase